MRTAVFWVVVVALLTPLALVGCGTRDRSAELEALLQVPPLIEPLRTASIGNITSIDRGSSLGIRVQAKVSADAVPSRGQTPSAVLDEVSTLLFARGWTVSGDSSSLSATKSVDKRLINLIAVATPTGVRLVATGSPG